ncbi:DNA polymerase III subunit alpha [Haematomicrobium sanguinis]|uniref:DNA polymerase III subunit alpha n=1 Tax=Haematomicrobium sanguinis TaxID=479106 RepID=UPI000AB674DD
MLDGAARLTELFERTEQLGMNALATTDHGFIFGAFDFWSKARSAGIKPIVGVEAYLTPGTARSDKTRVKWGDGGRNDVSGAGAYTHMTMWAENTAGMHNLFRMSSLASIEGFLYKPRMDRELLQTYGKGIIATTGCASGEVQTKLRLGQYDAARQAASEFQDIFGRDNFYCELMDHGLDIERGVQEDLVKLARELNMPMVVTNDLHYTHPEDAEAHAALLCVQSGSNLNDPKRFKFDADEFYLKSPAEMRALFSDFPEACDNTLLIAERCDVEFNTSASYMPRFPVPEGEDEQSWFVKEVEKGLHYRFPGGIPDEVRKQAEFEVGVITQMGFPGYFLVVADFINWAKENGIRVGPGRGSGAGSMVAYAMRITDLDPLQHGLIFERFLNPERVSMPDFDVDFDDRRRGEVIKYVTEKYGDERVAMIVTYGTIKSKQALKDASRVMGYPFSMGERLTKAMPPEEQGKGVSLQDIFNKEAKRYSEANEMRELLGSDPEAEKVFETAKGLEGLKRQWGVHAAGVIMSSDPLIDIIPLMKREQDGQIITQFDYPTCEGLGLIKMDFLGLRNLTIISDAVENVKLNKDVDLDLEHLPTDDRASYELLSRGDTLGVFQFDSGGYQQLCKLLQPDEFSDITALGALFRPGPMGTNTHTNYALRKKGQQPVTHIHPDLSEELDELLGETYGLLVYQEQVMAIAQKLAGYSLGQADILRRAMGKKKKEELDKQQEFFFAGMKERGHSEAAAQALWDTFLPFSSYGFNKSHAAAYGLVSYWTAYLKAHFPAEYMAALLTSVGDNKDRSAVYLNECRRLGITVLPPDVNDSNLNFTPVGEDIRFGMAAIRNVGTNVVNAIVETREEKGAFTSFDDFLRKVPATVCNKRTVESLIKSGAFDSLGQARRPLAMIHEEAVDSVIGLKRNEAANQFDLFSGVGLSEAPGFAVTVPDLPEWDKKTKLAYERDMLGLYVSDHPLSGLETALSEFATNSITDVISPEGPQDGAIVTIAGMITGLQRRIAKNSGNPYARLEIEDMGASMEVMFFGAAYGPIADVLADDLIVSVRGRVQRRDDGSITLSAQELTVPELTESKNQPVTIRLSEHRATEELLERIEEILRNHKGNVEVRMKVTGQRKEWTMSLPPQFRVNAGPELHGDLKVLLGPESVER